MNRCNWYSGIYCRNFFRTIFITPLLLSALSCGDMQTKRDSRHPLVQDPDINAEPTTKKEIALSEDSSKSYCPVDKQIFPPNEGEQSTSHKDSIQRPAWIGSEGIKDGWDWSMPGWVGPSPRGWLRYNDDPKVMFPGNRVRSISYNWIDLEPKDGVYDFASLRADIDQAVLDGYGVELHIKGATWERKTFPKGTKKITSKTPYEIKEGSAPRWLRELYKVDLVEEKPMTSSSPMIQITNMNIFHKDYHRKYLALIENLKSHGITTMDGVVIAYIHNWSKSRGEEGSVPQSGVEADMFDERMRAWADAYAPHPEKLIYVGGWGRHVKLGYELGIGQRGGIVERYLNDVENSSVCQSLDDNGYLVVDDTCPPIAKHLTFGDENEEYHKSWESRFGPYDSFYHRYQESMLRVLQMRRTFLWTAEYSLNKDLLSFVSLELGRTIADTPDVWVYLRESYVDGKKQKMQPVKNFERWLYQRDGNGSKTVATGKVKVPKQMTDHSTKAMYDFTSRRTDSSSGNRVMGFAIDDRFLGEGIHPVTIKITYQDVGDSTWNLAYQSPMGTQQRTVVTKNTGETKTATFVIDDAVFAAKGYDHDFSIESQKGDATVSFVRVIRGDCR